VLEVGDAHVGNWFSNVMRLDLSQADGTCANCGHFDLVVIHQSLGGCATLQRALRSARRMLRDGGWLALFGANRLQITGRGGWRSVDMPRATGWGFRSALKRAGFADVSLYVPHPPDCAPIYVIDAHPRSARAFFRAELAARTFSSWSPGKLMFGALVATNLMPYLQPGFIIVGRKC
jgi:SAM-dependent methyltransferase